MRAARFEAFGPPDVVRVVDAPAPRGGRGRVGVRVRAAALNPKDLQVRGGEAAPWLFRWLLPLGVAEDFAGEVVASDHPELLPGARAFGMLGYHRFGAAAEQVAARWSEVAPMPPGLDFAEAAALPLVGLTALRALRDLASLRHGQRLLVHGASGGVGTAAVQIGRALGAHVTASCSARNHDFVRDLGADAVHDYREAPPSTLEGRFDAFFDTIGDQPFAVARRALVAGGAHVSTVPTARAFLAVVGSAFGSRRARVVLVRPHPGDLRWLSMMVTSGALRPVVDARFPLGEIVAAQERVATGRARGKVVVLVG